MEVEGDFFFRKIQMCERRCGKEGVAKKVLLGSLLFRCSSWEKDECMLKGVDHIRKNSCSTLLDSLQK